MRELTKLVSNNKFSLKLFSFITNTILFFIRIIKVKNENGKVIVIALHKIGDTVYTIPSIKNIQAHHNDIIILCYEHSKSIYQIVFTNVTFIELKKDEFYFGDRIAKRSARIKLNKHLPTRIFDLTGVMSSATLLFNCGAKEIIGFNRIFFKAIYTKFNSPNKIKNSFDIYLQALGDSIPISYSSNEISISLSSSNIVLIHPFSGWKSKEWSLRKFIELGSLLSETYICYFVVPPQSIDDDISKALTKNNIGLLITKTSQELIDSINKCFIFISNDSGPLQIAALLGKPTFAIYGPTNPIYNKPPGNYYGYIKSTINCTPNLNERLCFTEGGKYCPSYECIYGITVKEVYLKLISFINHLYLG